MNSRIALATNGRRAHGSPACPTILNMHCFVPHLLEPIGFFEGKEEGEHSVRDATERQRVGPNKCVTNPLEKARADQVKFAITSMKN